MIATNTALTRIQSVGGYTVNVNSGSTVRAFSIYGGSRGINAASHNNLIADCVIDGPSGDGIHIYGRNTVVTNCIIRNSGGIGIATPANSLTRHVVVTSCIISNNASHGVYTQGNPSPTVWVENSLVVNNRGSGLYIAGDNSHVGTNGVFFCTVAGNSQYGVIFDYVYGMRHEVYNSIITGNGWNGLIRAGNSGTTHMGGVLAAGNGRADYALGAEAGRINWTTTYPLLQHGPGLQADYTPGATSAGLAAACAAPRPAPATDLAGNPRPASGADLGCYQTGLPAPAATRHDATYADPVRPDNSGDGLSWGTAKRDPAEALAITADGGTCRFAAGVYSNSWLLPANVTVLGAGVSNTVRVATGSEVGVYIPNYASNVTLRAVGVRGGTSGAVIEGADALLSECLVGPVGVYGVINRGAHRLTVDRCVVDNATQDGLVTMLWVYRSMTVSRSLFSRNAIGINLADVRVNPLIENCVLVANRGGGIGGGIDNIFVGTNLIQHCTIVSNASHGISLTSFVNQRASIQNNLLVSNTGNGLRIIGSNNGMLLHGANLAFGNTSANISITTIPTTVLAPNIESDPLPLRPDFAPAKESPAYNAAFASPLAVDFYGRPRPLNLRSEIGAVENDQTWGTVLLFR